MTSEVVAYPHKSNMEGFEWRVSIATVDVAGPFSRFNEVDRTLVLIDGLLDIRFGSVMAKRLHPFEQCTFAGELDVTAAPVGGGARDVNVMVQRDRWRAEVTVLDLERFPWVGAVTERTLYLFTTRGIADWGCGHATLEGLDCLYAEEGDIRQISLKSTHPVIQVLIKPRISASTAR